MLAVGRQSIPIYLFNILQDFSLASNWDVVRAYSTQRGVMCPNPNTRHPLNRQKAVMSMEKKLNCFKICIPPDPNYYRKQRIKKLKN